MNIAVIGGGAAGFFAAIHAKKNHPTSTVIIFEKARKYLSKVKISGGGRCNVTNGCADVDELCKAYPRGGKKLKKAFHLFNTTDTMKWFQSRGVPLVIQDDACVFPVSQNSQSIIDCLVNEAQQLNISIKLGTGINGIEPINQQLKLTFSKGGGEPQIFDKVIVATGGSPKRKGLVWLEALQHKIEDPVPSLFTFNMPNESITKLMGILVKETLVNIQGTKLNADGPLLVTHWGVSGPAILKLSAFGARILSDTDYTFKIQVNWVNEKNNDTVLATLNGLTETYAKKILANIRPYFLPERLWLHLLERSNLSANKKWGELGRKSLNKLMTVLTNDAYAVKGKTTFKEEFVTCGGVSLESIDLNTMQSKVCKNLYFAGEVMDIDAITGGYNFQAAWATGFIAGKLGD
ncbi:MAG: NAD(P)/FAD-dependent oxidoreductase [Pseudomonadota bacterium]